MLSLSIKGCPFDKPDVDLGNSPSRFYPFTTIPPFKWRTCPDMNEESSLARYT